MKEALHAFVLREARLLDERRFQDWLALFAEDGVYWVPTRPDQASPHEALSLVYETRALLAIRVERLLRPDTHVAIPPPRTLHQVGGIEVLSEEEVRSTLVMAQWRAGETRWFAARVLHRLRPGPDGVRMVLKRVDLIDSEAPHRGLVVPF
jgi:benzoate/toluate 1,2-dioxygenase beta subunit